MKRHNDPFTRSPYATAEELRPDSLVEAIRDELAHDPHADIPALLAEHRMQEWVGYFGVTS